ncbi:hypothetical protein GA0061100_1254 [Rhizobium hainanense]|uniref:Uncharacterized protein n=1 Tax=Rhizobium hainanense TaxID=52131 RepID=A0A1C3WK89_9HYPH|nr:hypothetical protein GA0061100_1254 [Rhizobium hainanense]
MSLSTPFVKERRDSRSSNQPSTFAGLGSSYRLQVEDHRPVDYQIRNIPCDGSHQYGLKLRRIMR